MQRMPSYPLWIIDPHFSVWSPCDRLTDANAQFWAGQPRRIYGFVRWNGTSYLFCGKVGNYPVLPQTDVRLSAFGTQYRFETQEFSLRVEFLSPLPPNDKELAACPVCFTRYAVERGELPADFAVSLAIHEEFCYDKQVQVTGGVLPLAGFEAAFMSRARNLVMSHMNDHLAPDWGDVYLAGAESWFVTESAYYSFLGTGEMSYKRKELESSYLVGISRSREGCFLTAFDDRVSIFYFGEWLKGYYFRNGKTIIDALTESFTRREDIFRRCSAFDKDLKRRCRRIGKGYYTLACAALRQTMGGAQIGAERKGGAAVLVARVRFQRLHRHGRRLLSLHAALSCVRSRTCQRHGARHLRLCAPSCVDVPVCPARYRHLSLVLRAGLRHPPHGG